MNEKRSVLREITGYSTTSNAYGKHNNNHLKMQNNYQQKEKRERYQMLTEQPPQDAK